MVGGNGLSRRLGTETARLYSIVRGEVYVVIMEKGSKGRLEHEVI